MIDIQYYQMQLHHTLMFKRYLHKRASNGEKVELKLYTKKEIRHDMSKRKATMTPFIIGNNAPCVVVCPGGAYQFISLINEGVELALSFNQAGYNAFVLNYRTGKSAKYPAPMQDLARCIQRIKRNPSNFNINTDKIHIVGSSAGGHLCSYFGARYSEFEDEFDGKKYDLRPTSIVLSYPVINLNEEYHSFSRFRILGTPNPSIQEQKDKSSDLILDENYPPVYFWHCKDDDCVPFSNSVRFDEALTKHGVEHLFEPFDTGGHGIGLAVDKEPEGWFERAVNFMKKYD